LHRLSMTVQNALATSYQKEKKEDSSDAGDRRKPDRKKYELWRPTPRPEESGVAECHAVMTSLSRSLKRDLSVQESISNISSHNLPSLSKTLKRNLSKGSQGGKGVLPNETFPLMSSAEETASLPVAGGNGTKRVIPTGSLAALSPHRTDRPRPSFQPNQVTWMPGQAPRLMSGVGSVFSSASAPRQGLVTNKESERSMHQHLSTSFDPDRSSIGTVPREKCAFFCDKEKNITSSNEAPKKQLGMPRVLSAPRLHEEQQSCKVPQGDRPNQHAETSPDSFYKTVIGNLGYHSSSIPSLQVKDYFLEYTPDQIAAYDHAVTGAVRGDDVDTLRALFRNGKTMQCSNKFGESIVHMACRKGSLSVIRFLVEEADVCLRVRDDFGRTPLHDACWASRPSFEAIQMLVRKEPDLLLLADKRGYTPLAYARREMWGAWCEFLSSASSLLAPKSLVKSKEEDITPEEED